MPPPGRKMGGGRKKSAPTKWLVLIVKIQYQRVVPNFMFGTIKNVVPPPGGVRGGNMYSPRHAYFRAGYETKMVLVSLNSSTAFFPSSRWPLPLAFMPPKGMCISAPVVGALM